MSGGIGATLLATRSGRAFLALAVVALLAGWTATAAAEAIATAAADGRPGWSLRDVEVRLRGDRGSNRFARVLNRPDGHHLRDPALAAPLTAWARQALATGFDAAAHRARFDELVEPVLAADCRRCHDRGGPAAALPLRSYADLAPLLAPDPGPGAAALLRRQAERLPALALLVLASGVLAHVFLPRRAAGILAGLSAGGLLLETAGAWATWHAAAAAALVPLGGLGTGAGLVLAQLGILGRLLRPGSLPTPRR